MSKGKPHRQFYAPDPKLAQVHQEDVVLPRLGKRTPLKRIKHFSTTKRPFQVN